MHIFVTNDDGVAAPGIRALAKSTLALAKITVIAPAEGVSSCSSALSLRKPMKLKKAAKLWRKHRSIFFDGDYRRLL